MSLLWIGEEGVCEEMKIIITLSDRNLNLYQMLKKIKDCCYDGHTMPIILDVGEMDEERIYLDGDGDFIISKLELIDE